MSKLITSLMPLLTIFFGVAVHADEHVRDVPMQDEITTTDQALSCVELDAEINRLVPLTYSGKPGFYEDPAHGAAIWGSVFWAPAIGYLGYSGVTDYYDRQDMAEAERRIAELRHLKAKRRCYQR